MTTEFILLKDAVCSIELPVGRETPAELAGEFPLLTFSDEDELGMVVSGSFKNIQAFILDYCSGDLDVASDLLSDISIILS